MKKIMELYGELVIGLIVLVFLLILAVTFLADGTFSGLVEEKSDAVLGNSGEYKTYMEQPAPEAAWTGEKIPAENDAVLLAYIKIRTADSPEWKNAAEAQTESEINIGSVRNVGSGEETAYNAARGTVRLSPAGAYKVDLTVTDKENRQSVLSLNVIAE